MPEIVIVRLPNWLGDTVMAVPALRSLRSGLPGARVGLAGPWASLLAGQGLADLLVTYPRPWGGRLRTADAVRDFAPHTAVLLPNSLEAALAAWYWRARRRIGFAAGGRSWLLTDAVALPSPRQHQVDEYLLLIERLGIAPVVRQPRLSPPGEETEARGMVRALLREVGAATTNGGPRPRVGVHVGAAFGPSKLWPAERIADFCRVVRAGGGIPVLLGTREDLPLAAAIMAAAPAASLVGRDNPALLPAVLAEIDALVCGDTGVGHLAAALGTPVVTLFGPTDPRLTAPQGRVEILSHPTPCSPCFYRACPIEHPCLASITAVEAAARLRRLLG
jgi:heptosyltransferase-2